MQTHILNKEQVYFFFKEFDPKGQLTVSSLQSLKRRLISICSFATNFFKALIEALSLWFRFILLLVFHCRSLDTPLLFFSTCRYEEHDDKSLQKSVYKRSSDIFAFRQRPWAMWSCGCCRNSRWSQSIDFKKSTTRGLRSYFNRTSTLLIDLSSVIKPIRFDRCPVGNQRVPTLAWHGWLHP